MLNRDFTKSNKDYFNKNKIVLICIAAFLLVGIVITAIFGMNGNFEFKGYNEFSVKVKDSDNNKYFTYQQEITNIVNSKGGNVDTVSYYGEGDNTQIVVRYMSNLSEEIQIEVEKQIIEKIGVTAEDVSNHVFVKPIVKATDYIYTATAILLLVAIASIFAYFRYNGASAIALMACCALGTVGFMFIGSILRIRIGMSYFAMLVILNMLIVYLAVNMFETIREESWLATNDYSTAIKSTLSKSKFRTGLISVAVMVIGVLFVILAPFAIKYVALNIMFIAVTLLAVIWYVLPFVWSVFITKSKNKTKKVKSTKTKNVEENN